MESRTILVYNAHRRSMQHVNIQTTQYRTHTTYNRTHTQWGKQEEREWKRACSTDEMTGWRLGMWT